MELSKTTKIWILLVLNVIFFLLELVVGSAVHSLALIADSFHMLNDVLSLCVGLWAVKAANERPSSSTFTYGWSRAETLGALVNGVFLVALCVSIFLEAIQRFFEPQEVKNPKLVAIVGSFGLAFNILGLFLFHDHGHSHGHDHDHEHDHDHTQDVLKDAEEGHRHPARATPGYGTTTPENAVHVVDSEIATPASATAGLTGPSEPPSVTSPRPPAISFVTSHPPPKDPSKASDDKMTPARTNSMSSQRSRRARASSRSYDEIPIHPASFRNDIINQARRDLTLDSSDSESDEADSESIQQGGEASEASPLLRSKSAHGRHSSHSRRSPRPGDLAGHAVDHQNHNHATRAGSHGGNGHGGHSHGDMNMKGIFLHVLGDALGNIGVIASALIIWLTPWSFRFYFDPLISLIITVIILTSALPLCKASSKILLQATPQHISVDEIQEDIEDIPGVQSCHHLHVWQLTPTKLIATLHVQVDADFNGAGVGRYMALAKEMRNCLHAYGIHSSTIQPEFCLDPKHQHGSDHDGSDSTHAPQSPDTDDTAVPGVDGPGSPKRNAHSKARPTIPSSADGCGSGMCLLECGDGCAPSDQCCAPGSSAASGTATPKRRDDEGTH